MGVMHPHNTTHLIPWSKPRVIRKQAPCNSSEDVQIWSLVCSRGFVVKLHVRKTDSLKGRAESKNMMGALKCITTRLTQRRRIAKLTICRICGASVVKIGHTTCVQRQIISQMPVYMGSHAGDDNRSKAWVGQRESQDA